MHRGLVDPIKNVNTFALHFQKSSVDRVRKLFCNALPEVMDDNKGDDETNECNRTERQYGGGIGHCLLKSATIVLLASSTARVTLIKSQFEVQQHQ